MEKMKNLIEICKSTFNGVVVNEDAVIAAAKENASEMMCANSHYNSLVEVSKETEQVENLISGETEIVRTAAAETARRHARRLLEETAYALYETAKNEFYGFQRNESEPVDGLHEQTFA